MHISISEAAFKDAETHKSKCSTTMHHTKLVVSLAHFKGALVSILILKLIKAVMVAHLVILPHAAVGVSVLKIHLSIA